MSFSKQNKQKHFLLIPLSLAIVLNLISCSKTQYIAQQNDSEEIQANSNNLPNPPREIFNPMGMFNSKFKPPEHLAGIGSAYNDYFDNLTVENFKKFYKYDDFDLKGISIKDEETNRKMPWFWDPEVKSKFWGEFHNPLIVSFNQELSVSNNSEDRRYLISQNNYRSLVTKVYESEYSLQPLKELSPGSVLSVGHDLLTHNFSPYCYYVLPKTFSKVEATILKRNTSYNVHTKTSLLISRRDNIKIALVDMTLKPINTQINTSDLPRYKEDSKNVFEKFESALDTPRFYCISKYSEQQFSDFINEILSSAFKGNILSIHKY